MMTREEIKQYAKDICIPLMERNAKRMKNGEYALKPDREFGRFDYYEAWSLHMYPLLRTLITDEKGREIRKNIP